MDVSEQVSWEKCPVCGGAAAVGWLDGQPVEFDCPGGCWPTVEQIRSLLAGPHPRPDRADG